MTVREADAASTRSGMAAVARTRDARPAVGAVGRCARLLLEAEHRERPVDVERTAQLPAVDIPLETAGGNVPWEGVSYGLPYQLVDADGVMTPALDKTRPVTSDPDLGLAVADRVPPVAARAGHGAPGG